jgi:hypothetical protein
VFLPKIRGGFDITGPRTIVHGYIVFEPSAYMNFSSGASPRIFDKQLKVFTVRDRRSTAVDERSIMLVKNCKY